MRYIYVHAVVAKQMSSELHTPQEERPHNHWRRHKRKDGRHAIKPRLCTHSFGEHISRICVVASGEKKKIEWKILRLLNKNIERIHTMFCDVFARKVYYMAPNAHKTHKPQCTTNQTAVFFYWFKHKRTHSHIYRYDRIIHFIHSKVYTVRRFRVVMCSSLCISSPSTTMQTQWCCMKMHFLEYIYMYICCAYIDVV